MSAHAPILIGTGKPTRSSDTPSDDLAKITEEMYKHNLELTVKNKTLSVLRSLSAITINALTREDVSQKIVNTIVSEMKFSSAILCIVNTQEDALFLQSSAQAIKGNTIINLIREAKPDLAISLTNRGNLLVDSLLDAERKITSNLLDVFTPLIDQEEADKIENTLHIRTVIAYPLTLGSRKIGALCLGLSKKSDDLSRGEKETIEELIGAVTLAIDRAQMLERIQSTNEQLQSANQQLTLLDKLKDEFVSVASHELRTPMTAIKSYVWMVLHNKAGDISDKARVYLDRVFTSTERLIHLVNEMLDVSRIESGRVKLTKIPFNPITLCDDMQNEFQAKIADAGMTLLVNKLDRCDPIEADLEKITQVLENLIGNAIKYSPKGATITLTLTQEDTYIKFLISDTGPGIPPDDMPRLFKKFGRLENSLVTVTAESSGLGLYISKQYVELHGGTIGVESTKGKGSTFFFTLPTRHNT